MTHFEEKFYDLLLRAQQTDPSLFPAGTEIHLGRSHRRGATTRATEAGVAKEDIEWINRWNGFGSDVSAIFGSDPDDVDIFTFLSSVITRRAEEQVSDLVGPVEARLCATLRERLGN
jgi:hypothetical protein